MYLNQPPLALRSHLTYLQHTESLTISSFYHLHLPKYLNQPHLHNCVLCKLHFCILHYSINISQTNVYFLSRLNQCSTINSIVLHRLCLFLSQNPHLHTSSSALDHLILQSTLSLTLICARCICDYTYVMLFHKYLFLALGITISQSSLKCKAEQEKVRLQA